MENSNSNPHNLIVNYLPQHFTNGELFSMFETIGPIESSRVVMDYKTNYSYGFGFVNFQNREDAERAIKQLNGVEIFNKRIKVSFARPAGEGIKNTNLYITNLPRHYTENDLESLFGRYGTILQKKLLMNKVTGLFRGVAFVRFVRREDAQEAIRCLDQQILEGGDEKLNVRVAEDHGKQRAAFYSGFQGAIRWNIGRGRGNGHGGLQPARGGSLVGHNIHNNMDNLVCYPFQNNSGVRVLRQNKLQQRYNPTGFKMFNNRHGAF